MQEGDIVYYTEQSVENDEILVSLKVNKILEHGVIECSLLNEPDVIVKILDYLVFPTPIEAWCNVQRELEDEIKELEYKIKQIDRKIEKLN